MLIGIFISTPKTKLLKKKWKSCSVALNKICRITAQNLWFFGLSRCPLHEQTQNKGLGYIFFKIFLNKILLGEHCNLIMIYCVLTILASLSESLFQKNAIHLLQLVPQE